MGINPRTVNKNIFSTKRKEKRKARTKTTKQTTTTKILHDFIKERERERERKKRSRRTQNERWELMYHHVKTLKSGTNSGQISCRLFALQKTILTYFIRIKMIFKRTRKKKKISKHIHTHKYRHTHIYI